MKQVSLTWKLILQTRKYCMLQALTGSENTLRARFTGLTLKYGKQQMAVQTGQHCLPAFQQELFLALAFASILKTPIFCMRVTLTLPTSLTVSIKPPTLAHPGQN